MATFFHISAKKWTGNYLTELRAPDAETRGFGEDTTPRLSVAPTLCQCLLATPGDDTLFYIYEVKVVDPIPPIESDGQKVWDKDTSMELWVVQSHLDRAKENRIEMEYKGWVERGDDLRNALRSAINQKKVRFDADEEKQLWHIEDGGKWVANFHDGLDLRRIIEQNR